jgi:hypothetical protein
MGPKRKRLFAEYPSNAAANALVKGKGKRREVPQLDDLLPISQHVTPSPSGSPIADPSPTQGKNRQIWPGSNSLAGTCSGVAKMGIEVYGNQQVGHEKEQGRAEELVRIEMGQMVMLKNMGHIIIGPVNGPNEGPPQYEVPRLWLQELETATRTDPVSPRA